MLDVKQAYNNWAVQYDTNKNLTRDLEAISLRQTLQDIHFDRCLEIGCGTGKNTEWLINKSCVLTAIDLSEEMLNIARTKINSEKVEFLQADIMEPWSFVNQPYDLVCFSLVLEHIENLDDVFAKAAQATVVNGSLYIGELHPFKQYTGTKARFETAEGLQVVTCFHHVSDFTQSAKNNGFELVQLREYFDDEDRSSIPRILSLLLKKQA